MAHNPVRLRLRGAHLAGTALAVLMALPAAAQDAQTSQSAAPTPVSAGSASAMAENAGDQIIVTGSRIAPPNATSVAPITSISGDALVRATGSVSVGDQLNDLPQVRSTFSQQNSTQYLGTHGLNLVDLYGLGTQRTLVLVNGRRHVGSDILNYGVSVDINTIPNSLIERVDTLTGGSSSIYGSDAIAGVVNFVLKQDFEGIQANMRGGVSTYGDAGSYLANITAGKNFAEGRGNIAAAFDYAHQTAFYGSGRPNVGTQSGFVVVGTDPAGSTNGAAGGPDRVFLRDIRSATISNKTLAQFASPTGACGRDGNTGAPFRCVFQFQPDGSLVPQTGTRVGIAPNGSFLGGNGTNSREANITVLQPQQNRYNFNLIGHYEVSPAFVPFFEAKYVRVETSGSQSGPAFFQGTTLAAFGYDTTYERPRLDNPFLTTQARGVVTQQLIASGTAAADIAGSTRFSIGRNLLDLGVRNESDVRQTYRIVGGVRGDFGSAGAFHYEVAGQYGEMKERTRIEGNLNVQRFLLAMDSTRNAAGQIVCRSQIDPTSSSLAQLPGSSGSILTADVATCQPLNPFGQGNISQAARNYVTQDTVAVGKIRQTDITGFVSGDSSQWFELPGGPIGVSIGGEYRRETNFYQQDPLVDAGYTFYNAIPTFSAPAFEVKEAFAEIRVPILKDRPFFHELTLTGSGRVSDYKGSAGTVWTYNGGGTYAPVQDIAFRGSYSRSVRAPNLQELYADQSANFGRDFADPCSARNIAQGTTTREANCRAAGIPAAYDYVYTQSLAYRSGGNPNLKAEKSDSYTFGTVITPRWVPGLTLSVDYYNFKVKNVINTVDAQTIADQCYDSATLANPFCSAFQRAGAGGGPGGEQQYRIIENSLLASSLNYASLKASGINVDLAYQHNFSGIGTVTARTSYTHVLKRDDFLDPTDPTRADRIRGELGDPIDAVNFDIDLKRGPVSIGYGLRYIGHMVLNEWEDTHTTQGRPPENADYADRQWYPAVWYHDVRASVDVTGNLNVFGGIDNVGNRKAPFGLTGVSDGSGIYDVRGRYFYAGARINY
jgi:outer membrane receptor protein involved in Fe transport